MNFEAGQGQVVPGLVAVLLFAWSPVERTVAEQVLVPLACTRPVLKKVQQRALVQFDKLALLELLWLRILKAVTAYLIRKFGCTYYHSRVWPLRTSRKPKPMTLLL